MKNCAVSPSTSSHDFDKKASEREKATLQVRLSASRLTGAATPSPFRIWKKLAADKSLSSNSDGR